MAKGQHSRACARRDTTSACCAASPSDSSRRNRSNSRACSSRRAPTSTCPRALRQFPPSDVTMIPPRPKLGNQGRVDFAAASSNTMSHGPGKDWSNACTRSRISRGPSPPQNRQSPSDDRVSGRTTRSTPLPSRPRPRRSCRSGRHAPRRKRRPDSICPALTSR